MTSGFRRYIGAGRYQPVCGQRDYCADGIRTSIGREGGGRPMFEFLPCGDEEGNGVTVPDRMTTDRTAEDGDVHTRR